jgi:AcrR family transcriptional regulator
VDRLITPDAVITRRRILNAAKKVFSEVGYGSTSYARIARVAGVTRPMVTYYFPDKADLYKQALEHSNMALVRSGIARAKAETTLSAQLRALAIPPVAGGPDRRQASALLAASALEIQRHPELHTSDKSVTEVRRFLVQAVEAAVQRGELPADTSVIAMADLLLALLWGVGLYAGFITGKAADVVAVTDQIETLLQPLGDGSARSDPNG